MAQVISKYTAVMTNTGYIYDRPSLDGDKTQYDYGTELVLPADYSARETDGFYPVTYPENNGWIQYYIVGSITPVYTTTTDACTAPASVTLDTNTKVLTISGGAGGDLNAFAGYGISWRDKPIGSSSYGSWSSDVVVSGGTTVTYSVTAPDECVREFRVRTLGEAGESFYSSYVVCSTTLTGTTTSACKAPDSVTLSGTTLTIRGGAGGDLNSFTGYGISWRDKLIGATSYGDWSSDVVVSSGATATYTVGVPAGYIRQFRARTRGSAGEAYFSSYVVCGTTLTGNRSPNAPVIRKPVANAKSVHASPVVVVECTADPDGDAMTLYRQIDGGSWGAISTSPVGTVYDQLPALVIGQHTVSYKLADPYAESAVSKRTFMVADHLWSRTIKTGDVISNPYISHRNDITEMLSAINTQRAFYGISGISLTGVGNFKSWALCMQTLLNGINACRTATGLEAQALDIPAYPTALVINTIRLLTTGVPTGNESNSENKLDYAILDQMFLA